jgi:hypothetical protein
MKHILFKKDNIKDLYDDILDSQSSEEEPPSPKKKKDKKKKDKKKKPIVLESDSDSEYAELED